MTAGAAVLAISAVFATKANKKFTTTIRTVVFGVTNKVTITNSSDFTLLTTVKRTTGYYTAFGQLYTTVSKSIKTKGTLLSTGGDVLYYIP